jgi:pimeloyl-ACP methyl ester carboxylesterase
MKPLLLLHGAIGNRSQLQPLQQCLSKYYDVHVLNFPGHGNAVATAAFSIPSFADHVKNYIEEQALEQVSIFGYSMGGYVALYLAAHFPGLVVGVATLATKFQWTEEVASKEVKMLQPDVILQKLPSFAQTLEQRHTALGWKKVLSQTADMLMAMGRQNVLTLEEYTRISIPVMLMLGDRDRMVTVEETMAVYKQLPNSSFAVLPKTSHPIEAVNSNMLSFLLQHFFDQ